MCECVHWQHDEPAFFLLGSFADGFPRVVVDPSAVLDSEIVLPYPNLMAPGFFPSAGVP